jgi:hypothetical protein
VPTNETATNARFIPIDRQQMVWRPTDIEELIGEDHAARSVWAIVGKLDLSCFAEGTSGNFGDGELWYEVRNPRFSGFARKTASMHVRAVRSGASLRPGP